MRSRLIASIAIASIIVPGLQPPLAGAQDITPGAQPAHRRASPRVRSVGTGRISPERALRTDLKPLPAATVRLRQFEGNGAVLASATTGPSGEFAFRGAAGQLLLELVDFSGRVVGMAPPFVVAGPGACRRLGGGVRVGRNDGVGGGRRLQPLWAWSDGELGGSRRRGSGVGDGGCRHEIGREPVPGSLREPDPVSTQPTPRDPSLELLDRLRDEASERVGRELDDLRTHLIKCCEHSIERLRKCGFVSLESVTSVVVALTEVAASERDRANRLSNLLESAESELESVQADHRDGGETARRLEQELNDARDTATRAAEEERARIRRLARPPPTRHRCPIAGTHGTQTGAREGEPRS